ncbi:MAG: hypothetical protein ABW217_13620 [Polyangiaceae bacterium]
MWLSGYVFLSWLARGVRLPLSRFTTVCLAPALALPAWSLLAVVIAELELLSCTIVGAIGWFVCVLLAPTLWRKTLLGHRQGRLRAGVLLAIALTAFALYAAFPHDGFFAGRDQGTYSNQALHIARTGQISLDWPRGIDERSLRMSTPPGWSAIGVYPGSRDLTVQFSPVLPIWLAFSFTAFGIRGLFGFNALIATLCVGVFFGLASRMMSRRMALTATAFFALNPIQLWIARIALSEILAQYLLLSGLLLAFLLARKRPYMGWLTAGTLVGASVLVRIDGFVLAPLAAGFGWLSSTLRPRDELRGALLHERSAAGRMRPETLGVCAVFVQLGLGVALYDATSKPYMLAQGQKLLLLGCVGLTMMAAWPIATRFAGGLLQRLFSKRSFWLMFAAALAALCAYAYFVRPFLEPFSMRRRMDALERDFRENSFVNLGLYITPVLALIAPAGLWHNLRRLLGERDGARARSGAPLLLLLVIWSGFSLLYLYNPANSPDHPWGMRRFVPVVIPGALLLSLGLLDRLSRRVLTLRWRMAGSALCALALLAFSGFQSRRYLFLKEYDGAYAFVTAVADSIKDERFVVCNVTSRTFGHLALARGVRALRYSLDDPERFAIAQKAITAAAGDDPYYVLVDSQSPLTGEEPIRVFETSQRWLRETTRPPATGLVEGKFTLLLYERRGPLRERSFDMSELGVRRLPPVKEGGFWPTERSTNGLSRWTKDTAWLVVPGRPGSPVRRVELRIIGFAPGGTWLTVRANGAEVHSDALDQAPVTITIDLPQPIEGELRLELFTGTFKPSDNGSADSRDLGVRLAAVNLL